MRTIIINSPEDDRTHIVAAINTHPDRRCFLRSQNDLNPDVIAGAVLRQGTPGPRRFERGCGCSLFRCTKFCFHDVSSQCRLHTPLQPLWFLPVLLLTDGSPNLSVQGIERHSGRLTVPFNGASRKSWALQTNLEALPLRLRAGPYLMWLGSNPRMEVATFRTAHSYSEALDPERTAAMRSSCQTRLLCTFRNIREADWIAVRWDF
jgi:hypothetical protein